MASWSQPGRLLCRQHSFLSHSVAICLAIHLNAVTVQFLDLWTVSLLPAAAFGEKRCVQEQPACCRDVENSGCWKLHSAWNSISLLASCSTPLSQKVQGIICSFSRASPASGTLIYFYIPKGSNTDRQRDNLPGTEHKICFVIVTKQIYQKTGGEVRKVSFQDKPGWSSPSSL